MAKRMQGYDQLIRHSTRLEQLALAEEPDEAARRAMRSLRRRIKMLQTTKIPYYEERIEALTFSRWDFIGGQEPF